MLEKILKPVNILNRNRADSLAIAIIGGGAAGTFAAIEAARAGGQVTLIEKGSNLLSKVKVSGGGRCNVTHQFETIDKFLLNYPRGQHSLKRALYQFGPLDTVSWFEKHGVPLKTESDGRMFPEANTSQAVIDCLLNLLKDYRVDVKLSTPVMHLQVEANGFNLVFKDMSSLIFDRVIIAAGGHSQIKKFDWLQATGHKVIEPVPSLFSFNIDSAELHEMSGLSLPACAMRIQGQKKWQIGPLVVTHWGLSGPAILKLSAWYARELHECNYKFVLQVNWLVKKSESEIKADLKENASQQKNISSQNPFSLPVRLWRFLLKRAELETEKKYSALTEKDKVKLIDILLHDRYYVSGKTTFKEEFVTCGGSNTKEVDFQTMQSRLIPGLFFAGEILDIDGLTGGFNFQAAWSTGFIAGSNAASKESNT